MLTRHSTFRQLGFRVRIRWLLQVARRGLVWGLAGATLISIAGRVIGIAEWPLICLVWLCVAVLGALVYGVVHWPDNWAVARAADSLGLAERITSSIYADARSLSVADMLSADARTALAGLDPHRFALTESRRAWWGVWGALGIFALLLLAPVPNFMRDETQSADAARVNTARQRVQAAAVEPPSESRHTTVLGQKTAAELRALRDALARSQNSVEAAHSIEAAQQRLAQLPSGDDYAWKRALDSVAESLDLSREPALEPLARALQARDQQAEEQALADLSARLERPGGLSSHERAGVQTALQRAANATASSQPRLAGELRRAASALSSNTSSALNSADVRDLLSEGVSAAAALDALAQAMADLNQLGAATLPPGARLVAATGTPTAYILVRGTPGPNATPVAVGLASGVSDNPASGIGPQRNGAQGGGAGYGDTPSQGRPSSQESPFTSTAGMQGVAPNESAPTTYDAVYAPSHLGGDSGLQVQAPGEPTGVRGADVDLPHGPLSVGDVRPYDQVYAEYAQAARQSTSRQSLPPNVQQLVERYFGAIAPPQAEPPPP